MAVLDTRGLVDGAIKGFGLVDSYYDKEEDRDRRDELDKKNESYQAQQQDNWQASQDENKRRYGLEDAYREKKDAKTQENFKSTLGLQSARLKSQKDDLAWRRNRTNREDARVAADREKQQDLANIQMAYSDALQGVELSEESLALMEKYPNYNIAKYLNPKVSASIDYFEQGAANIKSDDDLVRFVNSEPAKQAFSSIYASQIGKGDGKNKAVEAFMPITGNSKEYPGTVDGKKYIAVHIGEDGEDGQRYSAPVTHNRSSNPEDKVKLIPLETIQQQIQEMAGINGALKNMDAKAKDRLTSTMISKGWLAKPDAGEWKSGGDGLLYNGKTGESKQVGRAGGGKPTNSAKKYQELIDLGTPDDVAKGVAYGTMKSVSDPNSGSTVVIDLTTNQPIGGFQPVDPNKPFGAAKWVGMANNTAASSSGNEVDMIKTTMEANPSWDEAKSRAFLMHKGYLK
ncbi:MAG: hypothetical protein ACKVJE_17510 [Pseudomonadales bacterium]